MFSKQPLSAHDVTRNLATRYDAMIASGSYEPFLYPWGTIGAAVVIAYLLIDHRQSPILRRCRFLAFAFIFRFAIYCIRWTRARNPAAAFGVGLISAWSILWCAVMLVFHDAQTDFKRIERKERVSEAASSPPVANGHGDHIPKEANGTTLRKRNPRSTTGTPNGEPGTTLRPAQRTGSFTWQFYPRSPFIERLDWVADIFCNFRGMGWNWRINGLPPPPRAVQEQLYENAGTQPSDADTHVSRTGARRYHDTPSLLRSNLIVAIRGYLILDLLKTMAVHDPYMWGVMGPGGMLDSPPPAYLPASLAAIPAIVKTCRLLLSLFAMFTALQTIFSLGPLFFVGLLGPDIIGARGEPWMYPDSYGSFSCVLDKGLGGWWGGWWHQSFRFAFEAPATRLCEALGMNPKSSPAKLLQLIVAFTLSGCLHACGSYTQIGDTNPLKGPMRFFLLQIVGVMAQILISQGMKKIGVTQRLPSWVRRTGNFVYVHVWFYHTAPLLCDDFARGGIWLFEPVPLSLLRGLGFGDNEDGWWQWYGGVLRWHQGKGWRDTGIAL